MSDPSEPSLKPAESRAVELLRSSGARRRPSAHASPPSWSNARAGSALAVPLRAIGGLVAAIAVALAGAVRSGRGQGRP